MSKSTKSASRLARWNAASRFRRRQLGGTVLGRAGRLAAAVLLLAGPATPAFAQLATGDNLPTGGSVAAGSATITTGATSITVDQTTARAVINWNGYSVGSGFSVAYNQPDAQSATLNRVTGSTASLIDGSVTANGAIYLVNPNGIALTANGAVQVGGGFVASTLDVADTDFMAGAPLTFTGSGASAEVANEGAITAGAGGYVALLGGSIRNPGSITVPLGRVALGSAEFATLDINGGGFLQVVTPTGLTPSGALIEQAGTISASSGTVTLSVASARSAVRNAINLSGAISADSASGDGGTIVLSGGQGGAVAVAGTLTARATGATGVGGLVETSGDTVNFAGATVNTTGPGNTGTWRIVGTGIAVDQAGADAISSNLTTTDVSLESLGNGQPGSGNISLDGSILWNSNNSFFINSTGGVAFNAPVTWNGTTQQVGPAGIFSVVATDDVTVNAPITWQLGFGVFLGSNANIIVNDELSTPTNTFLSLYSDQDANGTGSVDFGVNGSVSTGGAIVNIYYNPVDGYAAPNNYTGVVAPFSDVTGTGSFLFPYMLVNTLDDLQAISTNLAGQYALNTDIDASATAGWNGGLGFAPLGTDANGNPVGGTGFTGQLNGQSFTISNLTINRPSVNNVGLFGISNGVIGSLALTGASITGGSNTGGVVGFLDSAVPSVCTICGGNNVSSTTFSGTVSGDNNVGGIVGFSQGELVNAMVLGAVVNGFNGVGGVVGTQQSGSATSVSADEATAVSGVPNVGGIVGALGGGTISQASSFAQVSGSNGTGGVAGSAFGGVINQSTAAANVSGVSNVGGFVGVTSDTAAIDTSTSTSVISVISGGSAVGGFVGAMNGGGSITNSSALADVGLDVNGESSDASNVGGFVGAINGSGSIASSHAGGTVIGLSNIGGFAGFVDGAVLIGVSADVGSQVAGDSNVGGLVGVADNLAAITNASSAATVVGTSSVGGLAGQLTGGSSLTGSQATGAVSGSGIVVGGAVGFLQNASIETVTASGPVAGFAYVGGLVGNVNTGTISQSSATGNVSGDAQVGYWVGGLVGNGSAAQITNSAASGNVTGNAQIGGLVGALTNGGSIDGSHAVGTVTGLSTGFLNFGIGGLVGYSAGAISNSFATGAVSGSQYVGGLVGWADNGGSITGSNASGNVVGTAPNGPVSSFILAATTAGIPFQTDHTYDIGGLAGLSNGGLANSAAVGSVTAAAGSEGVGGLVGEAGGGVSQSTASGPVSGSLNVGGLVGTQDNVLITGSTASGVVNGDTNVGGLVGFGDGTISDSRGLGATGGINSVGGLLGAGSANSVVTRSTASGAVTLGAGTGAGGLVGLTFGTINTAFATGTVSGGAGSFSLGGLVGILNGSQGQGTLADAYATGAVTGFTNVGGLVGGNTGSITRTYAVGAVSGTNTVGGLVGFNLTTAASVTDSLWNTQTSGQASGVGQNDGTFNALGRTTTQLQDFTAFRSTYSGFDFNTVWAPPNRAGEAGNATAHYPELYALTDVLWVETADASRVYGNANPAFSYMLHGRGPLDTLPSLVTAATPTTETGIYAITPVGAAKAGYRLVLTNGTLTITARPLSISADPQSKLYGAAVPTLSYTVDATTADTGLVNGDGLTGALATDATAASPVATYAISQGTLDAGPNYSISFTGAPLTVTPAPLTVTYTADPKTRTFGAANPPLTGTVDATGLVNGDTLTGVTSGTALFTTTADAASNVGQYAINGSGLAANSANYAFSFEQAPGNATALTITGAQLFAVTAALTGSVTKVYDGTNVATLAQGNFVLTGFVNGDGATVTRTLGTYAKPGVGSGIEVTTQLAPGDFLPTGTTNLSNYILPTSATGAVGVIQQAPVTVTYVANPISRVYGQLNPMLSGSVTASGLIGADTLANSTRGFVSFATMANSRSNAGAYAITGSGLTGINGNYAFSFMQAPGNASALTVTPASLTVIYLAFPVLQRFGTPVGPLNGLVLGIGLVNGDRISSVTSGTPVFTTTATPNSAAGFYAITGSGLSGISGNYTYSFVQSFANSFAFIKLPSFSGFPRP